MFVDIAISFCACSITAYILLASDETINLPEFDDSCQVFDRSEKTFARVWRIDDSHISCPSKLSINSVRLVHYGV
jgi:hypothetical protein